MKKIISDDFTIPVDSIQYFRVITGTNNETKETDYLVIAILKGNNAQIDLDNPNVIILNLDDSHRGFKTKGEAIKFKELLERMIDRNFDYIYLSDIIDDVNTYFKSDNKTERKSTMTDLSSIPELQVRS